MIRMHSCFVGGLGEFGHEVVEMVLVESEEMVEEFPCDGFDAIAYPYAW